MTSASPSNSSELTGRDLGDYRVLRRLGAGGMAVVYLAEQRSLGRQVALKALQTELSSDATFIERFHNEARAAASLVHSNIVQIYEVGQIEGVHFIAQEYIRGRNLGEVLKRESTLQPRLVLDVMRQVAAALCKAAEFGIVHRDIKPENIMLSQAGEVKVADFGLARFESADTKTLTQVGVAMGTPLYMSPEQIEGRPVDCRSDIYSLGITCYHLLAGSPPYRGETALSIAVQHLNSTPTPLENVRGDIPSGLARIVHQMIAKRPERRYDAAADLLADLRRLAGEAAQEGWAEGPDHWSLAEWIAATNSRGQSIDQLGRLMAADSQLRKSRSTAALSVLAILAAGLAGLALSIAFRPKSYLEGRPAAEVEQRETVWAQIFHAKMAPSEAAWQAACSFPDADSYAQQLAKQGLVRYYLFITQEFGKALAPLRDLQVMSLADDSQTSLQEFTYACLAISHQRIGQLDEARQEYSKLTSPMIDSLRRHDPRLNELLQTAVPAFKDVNATS
ncbi:MAG: serine/threonine-protein kinase [Planctomycetota bacterium]